MFREPITKKFPNITSLGRITTPYGGNTRYEPFHPGVDVANERGTQIKAPVSGVVEYAVGDKKPGDASFGNSVMIKDADGNHHNFGHLEQALVQPGQTINAGKPLGTMGNTGAAYSPSGNGDGTHLDYRIVSAYGRYKNPQQFLNKL